MFVRVTDGGVRYGDRRYGLGEVFEIEDGAGASLIRLRVAEAVTEDDALEALTAPGQGSVQMAPPSVAPLPAPAPDAFAPVEVVVEEEADEEPEAAPRKGRKGKR